MANSVEPGQTAPSGSSLFAFAIFITNSGVQSFKTFTILMVHLANILIKTWALSTIVSQLFTDLHQPLIEDV